MADMGGLNSIRSFARSWQRAAAFTEVIPRRPSFILANEPEEFDGPSSDGIQYGRNNVGSLPTPHTGLGLLRQHLEASAPQDAAPIEAVSDASIGVGPAEATPRDDFRERERKLLDSELASGALLAGSPSTRSSIFAVPPHLAAPSLIGSYGSHYGTIGSRRYRSRSSASYDSSWEVRGEDMDDGVADMALGEEQPILVKEVKQGDRVVLTVDGQSTLPQSIFNSINAIIGVGLLSLPLAFKMSGWIIGLLILTLTAAVTAHTAKLIGKCMEYDPSIITYSDLAYVAFGARARVIVSSLFTLELIAACVALFILFADSLDLLLPTVASATIWKCVCAALILVLNMLPLRWLSYTSVIGIFSTFCSKMPPFSRKVPCSGCQGLTTRPLFLLAFRYSPAMLF
jgi:vesicular inhibitory amino acid transporter